MLQILKENMGLQELSDLSLTLNQVFYTIEAMSTEKLMLEAFLATTKKA